MITMLGTVTMLYMGVAAGMYFAQRNILYLPHVAPAYPREHAVSDIDVLRLQTPDGENLVAWYREAEPGYPTLLYFHGNAGSLLDRTDKFNRFGDRGFGVFGLSWRGYGGSSGSPTEQGLYADGRTALAFMKEELDIKLQQVIVYGESLGTGVAVQMGTEYDLGGIVLEAPYTSIVDIGLKRYPFLPVRLLLKDHFDSISKIAHIRAPLLILHGESDSIIPVSHGRTLLSLAPEPKDAVFFADTDHVNFNLVALRDAVFDFAFANNLITAIRAGASDPPALIPLASNRAL